jgi:hypothetical protein
VGLTAKAFIPGIVDDDVASNVLDDPGNTTTDDNDDDGKPVPQTDTAPCKFVRPHAHFVKTFLVTVGLAVPHTLMPVHVLAVSDAATEPLSPDHFLPNAETGPPAGMAQRAITSPSHPPQPPPIIIAENGTTPSSFPRRYSV